MPLLVPLLDRQREGYSDEKLIVGLIAAYFLFFLRRRSPATFRLARNVSSAIWNGENRYVIRHNKARTWSDFKNWHRVLNLAPLK
jgi:hypothetical protein